MEVLKKKRVWVLLLLPAAWIILYIAKRNMFFAEEIMAKRVYKVLSVIVSQFTGLFSFSFAEITVFVVPFLVQFLLIRFIVHMVKEKERRFERGMLALLNVGCVISVGYFVYVVGCGVNYHRASITQYTELTVRDSSKEELAALCDELAERASELREQLVKYEDENGVFEIPISDWTLRKLAKESYEELAKELPVFERYYPVPKGIKVSEWFSKMELTGIFTCWTMEANVNTHIPDYSIPSTMTHELAHVAGFMKEEEANYIAYLACMASESPIMQYSGLMHALVYAGNALADQDRTLYSELWTKYHPGIVRDFKANSAYWDRYRDTVISKAADKVNDVYLKANEQEDGVKSYGRVVDLLLADYRKRQEAGEGARGEQR